MSSGTWPPKSAMIFFAAPTTDFDLLRKKPVERTSGSSCSGVSAAKAWTVGYLRKSSGVTRFTFTSVDCRLSCLRAQFLKRRQVSFAPSGLARFLGSMTHGLRRGLHSFAAPRLSRIWASAPRGLDGWCAKADGAFDHGA